MESTLIQDSKLDHNPIDETWKSFKKHKKRPTQFNLDKASYYGFLSVHFLD